MCVLLVTLALFQIGCSFSREPSPLVGSPMPLTRYTHLDGSYRAFSEFQDKRLVVVFWAEWCPYSRAFIEGLDRVAARAKGATDVSFIALSVDDAGSYTRLREWFGSRDFKTLTAAYSGNALDDEAYIAFGGSDLPHVFFVERNGTIVADGHSLSEVEEILERWESGEVIKVEISSS